VKEEEIVSSSKFVNIEDRVSIKDDRKAWKSQVFIQEVPTSPTSSLFSPSSGSRKMSLSLKEGKSANATNANAKLDYKLPDISSTTEINSVDLSSSVAPILCCVNAASPPSNPKSNTTASAPCSPKFSPLQLRRRLKVQEAANSTNVNTNTNTKQPISFSAHSSPAQQMRSIQYIRFKHKVT
jgi:hypothetical protein